MSRKENRERFHPTPKGSGYSRVLNHNRIRMEQKERQENIERLQQVIDTLLAVHPDEDLDGRILQALRNAAEMKAYFEVGLT